MKIKKFNTVVDFVQNLSDYYTECLGEYSVSIVAPFDLARAILVELILFGFSPEYIENFSDSCLDGYMGEYTLSLIEGDIFVEKAINEDTREYFKIDENICYIADGCSSKVLKAINGGDAYELHIGDDLEDECMNDCENCNCSKVEAVTDYDDKIAFFADVFRDYCEMMDEYNDKLAHITSMNKLIKEAFKG